MPVNATYPISRERIERYAHYERLVAQGLRKLAYTISNLYDGIEGEFRVEIIEAALGGIREYAATEAENLVI